MADAAHLRIVDTSSGEVLPECPRCRELSDQLAGAEKEVRAWRQRYANLKRDDEAKAHEHALWPEAIAVFDYWRLLCRHPRAEFSAERFWLVEPYVRTGGAEECHRAIEGAAYDPFVTTRKNGTRKCHDDFELIFRNRGKFEEFTARAPNRERRKVKMPELARDTAKLLLERARLIEEGDVVAVARLLVEIDRRNRRWLREEGLA